MGKKKYNIKKIFFRSLLCLFLFAFLSFSSVILYFSSSLPEIDVLYDDYKNTNIKILDRNGYLISDIGHNYGTYISYNQMPKHLVNAVLSTEDRKFFSHLGFDPMGIFRALTVNYKSGKIVQGGSTITQQLAKVVFLSSERTFKRKVQELMLAIYLEYSFTKKQIFEMYMNRIYFGSGNFGVAAASKEYFAKHVEDINLFEAATLAGIIKAPSRFAPTSNPELSRKRANQVITLMANNEVINADEILNGATSKKFNIAKYHADEEVNYFIDWIRRQIPNYVDLRQNTESDLIIYTTLDKNLQKSASLTLKNEVKKSGKKNNFSQGAITTISSSGEVLAMVGGIDYEESQYNRAFQAKRQPGSVAKIFPYIAAFENGYKPNSYFIDEKITINGWSPRNYSKNYRGNVTLTDAYAASINTVAVKLVDELGVDEIYDISKQYGIESDMRKHISLALGTSEMNLLELTGAYAKIANGGNKMQIHGIEKITNVTGDILYQKQYFIKQRVISKDVIEKMNYVMKAVVNYGTGKDAKLNVDMGGKTGTTQAYKDAWFIGYTSDLTTGVWVGNDDNATMKDVTGGSVPAKIWKSYMSQAIKGRPNEPLPTWVKPLPKYEKKLWESLVDKLLN